MQPALAALGGEQVARGCLTVLTMLAVGQVGWVEWEEMSNFM